MRSALLPLILVLGGGLGLAPLRSAQACGVNSHLWITDSAICQLPEGSLLRAFYADQRHVDLTRLGSSFPDSGYAVSHAYGEIAHWPPFVQSYIEDFHERFGAEEARWSDEARAEVAFILGVAAHGFEDELFDAQFLRWVSQEDAAGQDIIDPTIDFLLIYEGHTELYPPEDFPAEGVTSALRRAGVEVETSEIELGVTRVRRAALRLSQTPEALRGLVERDAPLIPWASRHYLNRDVKGSLAHEPRAVAALLWATYQRLRGEPVASLALSWVDPDGERLLDRAGVEVRDESRWVSLYFAVAADTDSVRSALSLRDAQGAEVEYEWRGARWGGGEGFTHLFEVAPRSLDGISGALTLELSPGVLLINGEETTAGEVRQVNLCPTPRCAPPSSPEPRVGGVQRGCWVSEVEPLTDGSAPDMIPDMNPDMTPDMAPDMNPESSLDLSAQEVDGEASSPDEGQGDMTASVEGSDQGSASGLATSGDAEGSASPQPGCQSSPPRAPLSTSLWLCLLLSFASLKARHANPH